MIHHQMYNALTELLEMAKPSTKIMVKRTADKICHKHVKLECLQAFPIHRLTSRRFMDLQHPRNS